MYPSSSPSNKSFMSYYSPKMGSTPPHPSSHISSHHHQYHHHHHSSHAHHSSPSSTNSALNSLLNSAQALLSPNAASSTYSSLMSGGTQSPQQPQSSQVVSSGVLNPITTKFGPHIFDSYLELKDGTRYYGKAFGATKCMNEKDTNWDSAFSVSGECVFTTAMVGYPESLTDPSYQGQILVLTFPLVGNYGAPPFKKNQLPSTATMSNTMANEYVDDYGLLPRLESDRIHIRGLIVQDYSQNYSHYEAICSLHRWLQEYNIPGIYHVDTRAITKKLRNERSMLGRIVTDINASDEMIKLGKELRWYDPGTDPDIIKQVTCKEVKVYGHGNTFKVIAIDCGMKYNIIRELVKRDIELEVVPFNYNWVEEVAQLDGLFISNGPGNPNNFVSTIEYLKDYIRMASAKELPMIPIFGICLGNQLVGKAVGAAVYKLPFGNRGHNQPVIDQLTRKCFITSQNHGYAVDNSSLPYNFKPYFINANDNSNEGIYCTNMPIFTSQFHPEAKGGPEDTFFLFDQFVDLMKLKINGKLLEVTNFESHYSKVFVRHHKNMRTKFNELLQSIEDTSDISTPIFQQQEMLMKKSIFSAEYKRDPSQKRDKSISKKPPLPKKVIVLGSGGLQIGQAGEFDYSGSQCIKALKEEGIFTILINPNIATVQTSKELADQVYFGPVTPDFVEKVIEKEAADGLLLSFGGQTALNCGVQLHKSGILEKLGCRVLGTPVQSIIDTEDRDIFNQKMREIGQPVADSSACDNVEEAIVSAHKIGFPVIVRAAFALGGLGSGFANDERELRELATQALSSSPQILVEKSVKGWKEIEYEVVRDINDNCITVCNMENFDPVGIHTGESIVVAPSQTLNNDEYHMLRTAAIKVIRHLGIVGECNIQYALNPYSREYVIIEVNARLSRSSALASKATGYPLAFVAAKLALGMELIDIKNSVTKETTACFEPALDYCVVKMPRWDLKKFVRVSTNIGSAMKSVGEVMAIGRNFEEAIQKAIRMVNTSHRGFETTGSLFDYEKLLRSIPNNIVQPNSNPFAIPTVINAKEEVKQRVIRELLHPTDQRIFAIALAMDLFDMTVDQIHQFTQIDRWFLYKLNNIVQTRKALKGVGKYMHSPVDIPYPLLILSKQQGFSDLQIASYLPNSLFHNFVPDSSFPYKLSSKDKLTNTDKELIIRYVRKYIHKIQPIVKQIDTLAAEYPAQTNYLYTTYNAGINSIALPDEENNSKFVYPDHHLHHDVSFNDKGIMVLGSGVYRIGSSVEFDYCGVMCIRELRRLGFKTVMINYNPETVSTDYDEPDRLYFEELSLERVMDIYEQETCYGAIISVGGQQPNNIALPLDKQCNVNILGTSSDSIDSCEDRNKFSQLLDSLVDNRGEKLVYQPEWAALTTVEDALYFANKVQYPVLIRPSYVLSGAAMNVAYSDTELLQQLYEAADVSSEHPVVISKFYENAKEIEIDGVAQNGFIIVDAISEHVERAGTHSGDATLICPPYSLSFDIQDLIREKAALIAKALNISGPFNMQFLFDNELPHDSANNTQPSSWSDEEEDPQEEALKLYRSLSKRLRVIECNLRASRSFPFVSKTLDLDFIALAAKVFTNTFLLPSNIEQVTSKQKVPTQNYYEQMNLLNEIAQLRSNNQQHHTPNHKVALIDKSSMTYESIQRKRFCKSFYGCKTPMFSFKRLADCDPKLGVEMASTGEVACFGQTVRDAFLKGMSSAFPNLPTSLDHRSKSVLIASFPHSTKANMELINHLLQSIYILYQHLRYTIYVSPYVAEKLSQNLPQLKYHVLQLQQYVPLDERGICLASQLRLDEEAEILKKIGSDISMIVDVPFPDNNQKLKEQHYLIRRKAINYDRHLFNNYEVFNLYVKCLKDLKDKKQNLDTLNVNPYSRYLDVQASDLRL
ncbi:hypothetical protein FDP41_006702 [Naegleria fowleri]|uniref:ATP-grasp domain-containing protein n=1 Tax=Naegleria fowleri TaxID=5763 RepID=A0A6A5BH06_NAEFO|nr:uncharacterized protein FDP41_006702 [Naegleria fowleri]KAF0974092.1 hypothetical protein FDP41_006702 [Naegleria fowleri]